MFGLQAMMMAGIVSVAGMLGCGVEKRGAGGGDNGSGGMGPGGAGSGGSGSGGSGAGGTVDAGSDAGAAVTDVGVVDVGLDVSPDAVPAPVRVTRGAPGNQFLNVTFQARGWPAEDEGRPVILRLGHPDRPPERLVAAEARIEHGGFRITVPMGCEYSLYKRKALLVDVDGDGACTLGIDRVYVDYSFILGDFTFVLVGSVPGANDSANMGERTMILGSEATAAEACEVINQPWPDT